MFSGSKQSFLKRRSIVILNILKLLNIQDVRNRVEIFSEQYRPRAKKGTLVGELEAEMAAYVDLEVSKRAECFIPAHISSSFSYMVMRQKELDAEVTISNIKNPFREYYNWGF